MSRLAIFGPKSYLLSAQIMIICKILTGLQKTYPFTSASKTPLYVSSILGAAEETDDARDTGGVILS
jgi:hypothetical protein